MKLVTTNFSHDLRGRLVAAAAHKVGGSVYHNTRFGYDAFGNMTSAVSPSGRKVGMGYDGANRLKTVRDGVGNFVNYTTYDTEGNLKLVVVKDASGKRAYLQGMDYDANNLLQRITRDSQTYQYITHNAFGNVSTVSGYNGHAASYAYDYLNRVKRAILPAPDDSATAITNSFTHDINDNPTRDTDGEANATNYVYDDQGRIVESTDAENRVTRYEYDAADNLTKIKDPNGHVTQFSYQYNATTLVVTKTYADSKTEVYTFDGTGSLVTKRNARNVTATYAYNDFGDGVSVSYSNGDPSVSYAYDAVYDRMSSRTDATGTTSYTYDANARVYTVDGPLANDLLTFLYDALGRVAQIDQQGGDTIYFTYDMQGRLVKVKVGTREFVYAYNGGNTVPDRLTRPNGSYTEYLYDYLYRLLSITNKQSSGTVITANSFTYNKAHMKTQEVLTNAEPMSLNAGSISYTPNAVNQIVSSTNPQRSYSYDYDGNMTSWYTPEGYHTTALYDAENRVKTVSYTDSQSVVHTTTFTYDADGLVCKQVVDGVETRFVRDGYLILQERDASNNVTRSYAWDSVSPGGIGGLLELTVGTAHYDYLYDGKGNVNALIDASQTPVVKYRNDAFGVLVGKSSVEGLPDLVKDQPYQFSTKRYLAAYGMTIYERRTYLNELGIFMEKDPAGESVDVNRYRAMHNNAINKIDPLGLFDSDTFFDGLFYFSLGLGGMGGGAATAEIGVGVPAAYAGAQAFGYGISKMIIGAMTNKKTEIPYPSVTHTLVLGFTGCPKKAKLAQSGADFLFSTSTMVLSQPTSTLDLLHTTVDEMNSTVDLINSANPQNNKEIKK